jgi:hypothetical protein
MAINAGDLPSSLFTTVTNVRFVLKVKRLLVYLKNWLRYYKKKMDVEHLSFEFHM